MIRALAVCLVLAGSLVQAQSKTPSFLVEAPADARLETLHLQARTTGPARVGADGRAAITILVTPKPKMHVYGADVDGYVPFTLTVQPREGLSAGRVTYPPSETYVFPPTGESSRAYMKPFRVTQTLTVSPALRQELARGATVSGVVSLRYQACDDAVCYRPTTATLTFELAR